MTITTGLPVFNVVLHVCDSMDLLQMDIHRRVNEFMHLSLSKVSAKAFQIMLSLFDPHDGHRQLAGRGI